MKAELHAEKSEIFNHMKQFYSTTSTRKLDSGENANPCA